MTEPRALLCVRLLGLLVLVALVASFMLLDLLAFVLVWATATAAFLLGYISRSLLVEDGPL